jgi:solute carrier family 25 S-adenosylmethionine transporter 26
MKLHSSKCIIMKFATIAFLCFSPNQVNAAAVVAAPTKRQLSAAQKETWTTFRQAFFRGGVSRSFGQAILYPVDALRTLAQTRDAKTLSDVGTKALVRGCFTTSSFALVMGALQFSMFNSLKQTLGTPIAAACGATASCLVSVPQEVIKQNLVTGVYPSFRSAVKSIATEKGASGFYSAWRPTMLRNVPFVIITFTTQDALKTFLLSSTTTTTTSCCSSSSSSSSSSRSSKGSTNNPQELTVQQDMMAGMASALVAGAITNPMDVIKTRMMTQASSTAIPYKSALDCFTTVLQKEGISTFYAGFQQRSIYMCGLWGITFAINGRLNSKNK